MERGLGLGDRSPRDRGVGDGHGGVGLGRVDVLLGGEVVLLQRELAGVELLREEHLSLGALDLGLGLYEVRARLLQRSLEQEGVNLWR